MLMNNLEKFANTSFNQRRCFLRCQRKINKREIQITQVMTQIQKN